MDSYEIIKTIAEAKKKTPAKIYLQGALDKINFSELDFYGSSVSGVLFCEHSDFENFYEKNKQFITKHKVEVDRRNSAIPMADLTKYNCRISSVNFNFIFCKEFLIIFIKYFELRILTKKNS